MATNKVVYGNTTLIDTTGDTADVSDVKSGETFHSRSGAQLTGTMVTSPKNVWKANCTTSAASQYKTASTLNSDFELENGSIVVVTFSYQDGDGSNETYLNVDNTGSKRVYTYLGGGSTGVIDHMWGAGENVAFVYTGSAYVMINGGIASGVNWGRTKLSVATDSTSTSLAATPSAVKAAYDLANSKIGEDSNGDISITRNISAGGVIEAENLPGIIKMFAGTFAPTGWLLCNGDEVAIDDYPALYDVIQDTYGTPSDSDHFVLPDLRGRMPLGSSNSHVLGSDGGSEYLQNHAHSGTYTRPTVEKSVSSADSITGGSHSHALSGNNKTVQSGSSYMRPKNYSTSESTVSAYTTSSTTHTHSVPKHAHTLTGGGYTVNGVQTTGHAAMTTGDAGNMPPFLTINYIISTGGVSRWADSAGLPIVRDVTVNGQSVVNNEIARILTGTVLWTGTWSSGSKTISGLGDYLVYLFYEDAGNALIGFPNEAGHIRAFGLTGGAAGNQYAQTLGLAYSNGEYTFQYCNQVTHNVSGNHSAETSRSITKIIGLIPKIS